MTIPDYQARHGFSPRVHPNRRLVNRHIGRTPQIRRTERQNMMPDHAADQPNVLIGPTKVCKPAILKIGYEPAFQSNEFR